MKTTFNSILLFILLMVATLVNASSNSKPVLNNANYGKDKSFTNTRMNWDGDKTKNGKKDLTVNNTTTIDSIAPAESEKELSYLRFDINKYVSAGETEITELPDSDFDYLRFDVNTYMEQNPVGYEEMPVSEFDYLRFDVNKFIASDVAQNNGIGELPTAE